LLDGLPYGYNSDIISQVMDYLKSAIEDSCRTRFLVSLYRFTFAESKIAPAVVL